MKGTVRAKKSRAVGSPSPVHTADVAEDSYVIKVNDNETQQNELETVIMAGNKTTKNKSRLSEIDSGILIEEEEDNLTVGQAPRRKVSSGNASVKQDLSATRACPSQNKSCSSNSDAHASDMKYKWETSHKFVTFSSEGNLEMSHSPHIPDHGRHPPASHSKLRNFVPEFDDANIKELSNADDDSEFLRKEVKQPQSDKKQTRRKVDKHRGCTASFTRHRIVSDSETDDDNGHHSANDNLIMVDSSDADEPASAANHLAVSNSHTDTGIVVILYVHDFFVVNFLLCRFVFFVVNLTLGIFTIWVKKIINNNNN